MNFDPLYYATLNPIVLKLHVFAGTLLAASVLWHWTRGAYSGLLGKTREGLSKWWSAGVALLFFLFARRSPTRTSLSASINPILISAKPVTRGPP